VTLREYRKGDWAGIADLWGRNPSDEYPLLGFSPDAVGTVLRKTEGLGFRFVLGLARRFGRPIFIVLIVDLGGRVTGTTLLNFTRETSYVSGVVVDSSVRHQGYAQTMMRACDDLTRRYHRSCVTLDVLSQNHPAIRLYEKGGYQPLRDQLWLVRPLGRDSPLPAPSGTTSIRPYRSSDGAVLAELDNALMSPEVRKIVPRHARDFRASRSTRNILQAESQTWVAEFNGRPAGFLQATVSHVMEAANLSSPIFGRDVPDTVARDLLLAALHWTESQRAPRVLSQVPEHEWGRRPLMESLGFVERFRAHTMVHRLAA
jgi:ribosomal protein S18 acetylase RimI-like enzyme